MASKNYRRKPTTKRKSNATSKWIFYFISFVLFLFVAIGVYTFRDGFLYYLGFKTDKNVETLSKEERKLADIRIYEVLHKHDDKAIGFDVSEYQSEIDWEQTYHLDESFELSFVFIRATAGKNKVDSKFKENWKASKERQLIRGAYHYYRPNENSIEQAENFI